MREDNERPFISGFFAILDCCCFGMQQWHVWVGGDLGAKGVVYHSVRWPSLRVLDSSESMHLDQRAEEIDHRPKQP